MGFYTQLIFNNLELPRNCIRPLRDCARKILREKDHPWSYMLHFIYVENSHGDVIDLQLSKPMIKHLTATYGRLLSLDEIARDAKLEESEEEDSNWYTLKWEPYKVGRLGKWHHTEDFVAWLSAYCISGQVFQITEENGGGLWGWEMTDGRFRELELKPKGRWKKHLLPTSP